MYVCVIEAKTHGWIQISLQQNVSLVTKFSEEIFFVIQSSNSVETPLNV